MNVLLTDPGYLHSIEAARSLLRSGHEVFFFEKPDRRYQVRGVTYGGLARNESGNCDSGEVCAFMGKHGIESFLPVGGRSVQWACRNRDGFEELVRLSLPPLEVVELALDKLRSAKLAREVGVPVADFVAASSPGDLNGVEERLPPGPVVVKGDNELSRFRVQAFDSAGDAVAFLQAHEDILGEGVLVQKCIDGGGFGFFALYRDGECIAEFMHRRVREFPKSGGASACCESVHNESLRSYGRAILDKLSWNGVAMVEFKQSTEDGDYYFLEVNPKFWGSLGLPIWCGVDFPKLAVDIHCGTEVVPPQFESGRRFHYLSLDFSRVQSFGDFFSALRDFINPKVGNNLDWSDPVVSRFELARACRRGLRGLILRR